MVTLFQRDMSTEFFMFLMHWKSSNLFLHIQVVLGPTMSLFIFTENVCSNYCQALDARFYIFSKTRGAEL